VTVLNVNREPYNLKILTPKAGEQFKEGTSVVFDGMAEDPDGEALEYVWFEGTKELGSGHNLSVVLAPGPHGVVMQASDGQAVVKSKPQSFIVKANTAPQLWSLEPSNGQKFTKGTKVHFRADAGDADNDTLSYSWMEGDKVLSTASSFDKSDLKVGTHSIRMNVTDGRASTETVLTFEVVEPPATSDGMGSVGVIAGIAVVAVISGALVAYMAMRKRRPPAEATRVDGDDGESLEAERL
jgi:hypothetical protein